ncbi:muropeptide transporter [Fuerstiella marisgermanici]|uniref:Muropeptide transporter n=2 Tax=Fuerstiella marisgermanici TaxID=1891926 RepID=A0A1P8WE48_9PLAN|nr:muropeptide transporter [Fuerstiella marisgermanici]
MYLSENRLLRMSTLCGLYVAQGIPWGFVTVTFAAWLAKPEHGITAEQIGPILAVASLPWSFKFVWGPMMDRFTIRRFGRRRPWIVFAQSMAILVLGSLLFFDDLPSLVWTDVPDTGGSLQTLYRLVPGPLAALVLLANIFVSVQDVAVDALAVDLLREDERGVANGLMYGSSYLGSAIGGMGLGIVVARYGIRAGLLTQAAMLFAIMLLPICFRERPAASDSADNIDAPKQRLADPSAGSVDFGELPITPPIADTPTLGTPAPALDAESDVGAARESVFMNLLKAFSLRSTLLGAFVALGTKIGIGVLTAVFVDYLIKQGGWSQEDYSSIIGGWALLLGLSGAAAGGFLADRLGPKRIIFAVSLLLGSLWIGFGLVPSALAVRPLVIGLMLSQELLLGVLSVSLFTLFMSISWPRVAATQFTAYMSLMNVSTTIGSYLSSLLVVRLSIAQILMVSGVLQIVMVLPVLLIDVKQTRRVLGES